MSLPKVSPPPLASFTDVFSYYTLKTDREAIVGLLRSVNARAVIETGVNEGFTAKLVFSNVPSVGIYQGIDVLPGYKPALAVQNKETVTNPGNLVSANPCFKLFLRKRGSFELTPSELTPCDAFFIDGDHGREAVLNDTKLARACVRSGGVIMWHDYPGNYCDVASVLEDMEAEGAPIFHVKDTWLAFERVP